MYPWSVPDEIIYFVFNEFFRFNIPYMADKYTDIICETILLEMAVNPYYPDNISGRYYDKPGLSDDEKLRFLEPIVKQLGGEENSISQLHAAVWAALMFCWSDKGDEHVQWYRFHETNPRNTTRKSEGKILQFPMVVNGS